MKILFLSNYYTHHQQPLCRALDEMTDHQFTFVSTEPFPEERRKLGWTVPENISFVREYKDLLREEGNAILEADVVILGSAPLSCVQERLKAHKLVFFYAERVYKNGYQPLKWLPRLYRFCSRYGRHRSLYLLAASGYTPADYGIHGAFLGKSYRWGYFPETKQYDLPALMKKKDPRRILWCGRFVDWKHPEAALDVARRLKEEGCSFRMELIGMGEMEPELVRRIDQESLADCVCLPGAMSAEEVRTHMESAGIYLFTSDFHEGWGAVLNEAMNSGCAVVASHAIGSVPFLLEHGRNGLIYRSGDPEGLYRNVRTLLDQPREQWRLGEQAYRTITEQWNAETAAERLIGLAEDLQSQGSCTRYLEGPGSRAKLIWNNWFRG